MSGPLQALERESCPACGAKARWDPARQALICPYCGTAAPGELDRDSGRIVEIDLARALREMPEELRGWQADRKSVKCRSCHAVSVFDPERVGQNCSFCGSPELVDYEELRSPLRPQSLLPFRIDETRVKDSLRKWLAGKWLAPPSLRRAAWVDTVRSVYLPYWTFDARVRCRWSADSGTYYYVNEMVRGPDGRAVQRPVRHVRWQPAQGALEHLFDDEPVPGTTGVSRDRLRAIEPFPTGDLVPYDVAYLSGFVVEHYQVVLLDAAKSARESMEQKLHALCAAQVPGDTHRNLTVEADWSGETFKHILVPVWILAYGFHGKTFQLLVNGATGKIAGDYPKSALRVALLVLGILAAVIALAWFASRG